MADVTGTEPTSEVDAAGPAGGPDALEDAVRSIGGQAQATNLARAHHLADVVADAAEMLAGEARGRAAEIAHQIAGSAGTFGFPRASQLAAEIERLSDAELDPNHLQIVRGHVQELLADLKGEPTY